MSRDKDKYKYNLTFSHLDNELNNEMRYFFGVSFSKLLYKSMKFMYCYMKFKKDNPNGNLIFEKENGERTILVIFDDKY